MSGNANVALVSIQLPEPDTTETFITRKRQRFCFTAIQPCCRQIFCCSDFYWPFGVQAGDGDRLPLEDWRRIPTVRDTGTHQTEPVTTNTAITTNITLTLTKGNG
jgi:hypothetical protein